MNPDDSKPMTVNGQPYPAAPGLTVAELVQAVHTGTGVVVVEVNGGIIARERFGQTPLRAGDSVEIVHFVGGG